MASRKVPPRKNQIALDLFTQGFTQSAQAGEIDGRGVVRTAGGAASAAARAEWVSLGPRADARDVAHVPGGRGLTRFWTP